MAWHCDCHVDVDLQVMRDTFVHGERVRRLAKQVLAQLVPDEEGYGQGQEERQKSTS